MGFGPVRIFLIFAQECFYASYRQMKRGCGAAGVAVAAGETMKTTIHNTRTTSERDDAFQTMRDMAAPVTGALAMNMDEPEAPAVRWLKRNGMAAFFTVAYFALVLSSTAMRAALGIEGEMAEHVFTVMALFGSVTFGLRLVMMMTGGLAEDVDADHDTDMDGGMEGHAGDSDDGGDADHADMDADTDQDTDQADAHASSSDFKLLSLQTVAAFSMSAGWLGLAAMTEWGLGAFAASAIGYGFGLGTVWFMTKMLRQMSKLHSSGTMRLSEAVAMTGRVYSRIPAGRRGEGQVEIELNGALRVLPAVTDGAEDLQSFREVLVVDRTADGRLIVIPHEG